MVIGRAGLLVSGAARLSVTQYHHITARYALLEKQPVLSSSLIASFK